MSLLFSPYKLKDLELKNRVVVSPMCQYSSVDGFANDWHLVHLGSRAVGGAGLIITEAAAVSPEGRISPQDLGIWKNEHIEKLTQINSFLHAQGAVSGIQLAHAGRKASTFPAWKGRGQVPLDQGGWKTLSASEIPFHENEDAPEALGITGIQKVITDFGTAAERAISSGFQVIEIHGAHGYLLHQFLSPISNKRTDEYGGSFENRIRLLLEIVTEIKTKIPASTPLFVRLSATDWAPDGWDIEQSVKLSALLKHAGVDLIDVSSGGLASFQKIQIGPGYQVPFAARIRKEAGIPTGTVGLITSAQQSEKILESGEADLIFMARELLRNPYFPLEAAPELDSQITWPVQYERAKP